MNIKRAKNEIKNALKAYLATDEFGAYRIPPIRQRPIPVSYTHLDVYKRQVQGLPQTLYSMHRITMTEDTNMDEFLAELAK